MKLPTELVARMGSFKSENDADKTVVVGGDVRLTSEALKQALANGLMDAGINVIDIGVTGTEEIYFATFYLGVDGGIEVTASHNPMDYNGMKLVREGSKPISGDTGLREIQALAERMNLWTLKLKVTTKGFFTSRICRSLNILYYTREN